MRLRRGSGAQGGLPALPFPLPSLKQHTKKSTLGETKLCKLGERACLPAKRNCVPHSKTLRVVSAPPKGRQVLERARQRRFCIGSRRFVPDPWCFPSLKAELRSALQDASRRIRATEGPTGLGARAPAPLLHWLPPFCAGPLALPIPQSGTAFRTPRRFASYPRHRRAGRSWSARAPAPLFHWPPPFCAGPLALPIPQGGTAFRTPRRFAAYPRHRRADRSWSARASAAFALAPAVLCRAAWCFPSLKAELRSALQDASRRIRATEVPAGLGARAPAPLLHWLPPFCAGPLALPIPQSGTAFRTPRRFASYPRHRRAGRSWSARAPAPLFHWPPPFCAGPLALPIPQGGTAFRTPRRFAAYPRHRRADRSWSARASAAFALAPAVLCRTLGASHPSKRNCVPHSKTLRVVSAPPKCRQVLERARQRRFCIGSRRFVPGPWRFPSLKAELRSALQDASRRIRATEGPAGLGARARQRRFSIGPRRFVPGPWRFPSLKAELRSALQDASRRIRATEGPTGLGARAPAPLFHWPPRPSVQEPGRFPPLHYGPAHSASD